MKKFNVYLSGSVYASAVVEVEAESAGQAEDLALECAENGNVEWNYSNEVDDVNVVEDAEEVEEG